MSMRLINLVGGTRSNVNHRVWHADAFRRGVLSNLPFTNFTYSHDAGSLQFRELKSILNYCETEKHYTLPNESITEANLQSYINNTQPISSFDGTQLAAFSEDRLIIYLSGPGIMEPEVGITYSQEKYIPALSFAAIRHDQKALLVLDTCCGPEWIHLLPQNISVFGTYFTSGMRYGGDESATAGTLMQWALDKAFSTSRSKGDRKWFSEFDYIWNHCIFWENDTDKMCSKIQFNGQDEWETIWMDCFPKVMEISPSHVEANEDKMFDTFWLRKLGVNNYGEVRKLALMFLNLDKDAKRSMTRTIMKLEPMFSPTTAEAVATCVLGKNIHIKTYADYVP